MKLVIRTLVFHFLCIILFALMYMFFSEHFESEKASALELRNFGINIMDPILIADSFFVDDKMLFFKHNWYKKIKLI